MLVPQNTGLFLQLQYKEEAEPKDKTLNLLFSTRQS